MKAGIMESWNGGMMGRKEVRGQRPVKTEAGDLVLGSRSLVLGDPAEFYLLSPAFFCHYSNIPSFP
jgi:hypothetical protein